jgi:hypothetical protein
MVTETLVRIRIQERRGGRSRAGAPRCRPRTGGTPDGHCGERSGGVPCAESGRRAARRQPCNLRRDGRRTRRSCRCSRSVGSRRRAVAALGVAAVLDEPERFAGRRVTTILSGSSAPLAEFAPWVLEPSCSSPSLDGNRYTGGERGTRREAPLAEDRAVAGSRRSAVSHRRVVRRRRRELVRVREGAPGIAPVGHDPRGLLVAARSWGLGGSTDRRGLIVVSQMWTKVARRRGPGRAGR